MSPLTSMRQERKSGTWKETCIGLWSRSVAGDNTKQQQSPICMGINLVRVQNLELETVQPTNTVGLQIIIQDTTDGSSEKEENANRKVSNSPQNVKTVWEQEDNSIGQLTTNLKQWSKEWTDIAKEVVNSPERREYISKKFDAGYKQIREWTEKFWK
ncbi:uncharacterized protein [Clytia hemisphaerica]|uniref:Uncharacterized protein n=1 Tax=Clytia hemisphaerica TaxID=252671 RepID=A0A7M5WZ46_9CNID